MGKQWTLMDDNFLTTHYSNMGASFCATYLNRTTDAIWSRCRNKNIKMTKSDKLKHILNKQDMSKKYKIHREMFINVQTAEAAYILGLLWADGSIRNTKNSTRITITLKKSDALELINIFNKTGNWKIQEVKYKCHKNEVITISCHDRQLYNLLLSLDFFDKSQVSANNVLTHIPTELQHYWWRGYFDGDGNITTNYKTWQYSVAITSTYEQDWSFISHLSKNNITSRVVKGNKNKNSYSRLLITGKNNIENFINYIYKEKSLGLSRKYTVSMNFIQYLNIKL